MPPVPTGASGSQAQTRAGVSLPRLPTQTPAATGPSSAAVTTMVLSDSGSLALPDPSALSLAELSKARSEAMWHIRRLDLALEAALFAQRAPDGDTVGARNTVLSLQAMRSQLEHHVTALDAAAVALREGRRAKAEAIVRAPKLTAEQAEQLSQKGWRNAVAARETQQHSTQERNGVYESRRAAGLRQVFEREEEHFTDLVKKTQATERRLKETKQRRAEVREQRQIERDRQRAEHLTRVEENRAQAEAEAREKIGAFTSRREAAEAAATAARLERENRWADQRRSPHPSQPQIPDSPARYNQGLSNSGAAMAPSESSTTLDRLAAPRQAPTTAALDRKDKLAAESAADAIDGKAHGVRTKNRERDARAAKGYQRLAEEGQAKYDRLQEKKRADAARLAKLQQDQDQFLVSVTERRNERRRAAKERATAIAAIRTGDLAPSELPTARSDAAPPSPSPAPTPAHRAHAAGHRPSVSLLKDSASSHPTVATSPAPAPAPFVPAAANTAPRNQNKHSPERSLDHANRVLASVFADLSPSFRSATQSTAGSPAQSRKAVHLPTVSAAQSKGLGGAPKAATPAPNAGGGFFVTAGGRQPRGAATPMPGTASKHW